MLVLDIGNAALPPDSEAGGASLPFEVLGTSFYSGLTLGRRIEQPTVWP